MTFRTLVSFVALRDRLVILIFALSVIKEAEFWDQIVMATVFEQDALRRQVSAEVPVSVHEAQRLSTLLEDAQVHIEVCFLAGVFSDEFAERSTYL